MSTPSRFQPERDAASSSRRSRGSDETISDGEDVTSSHLLAVSALGTGDPQAPARGADPDLATLDCQHDASIAAAARIELAAVEAHHVSLELGPGPRARIAAAHLPVDLDRGPLPVDARVVVGAAAKGRSSAPAIRRRIMRAAALALAGDLHLCYAYIPSEDNLADTPPRGIVRR